MTDDERKKQAEELVRLMGEGINDNFARAGAAAGGGRYDAELKAAHEATGGKSVVLIVIEGAKGPGFGLRIAATDPTIYIHTLIRAAEGVEIVALAMRQEARNIVAAAIAGLSARKNTPEADA